jgi:hypothetical protein
VEAGDDDLRRVRFYGPTDLAANWHAPRVVELASGFDSTQAPTNVNDVLELHNVQQYLEHGLLPSSLSSEERDVLIGRVPQIRSVVARVFSGVDNSNVTTLVTASDFEYHEDLVNLLGRNKAFDRCDSAVALPALREAGVHLSELLASETLVKAYDAEMRNELLAVPRNAEHLARKYLEKDSRASIHLPPSFSSVDARDLFERYIDSEEANLNYVRLIATARDNAGVGIDAKLRLRAERRSKELTAELFKRNPGSKTGCEIVVSDSQQAPVEFEIDTSEGSIWRYTYSQRWLKETTDNASILNNLLHLFEFADQHALLTQPAYPSQFGVMERVMGVAGQDEYKISNYFRKLDDRSLLQTHMYMGFLKTRDIELERVISWFFDVYLVEEFGMANFSFNASDSGTPYLHRVRHLFAEMESVATQFSLFVGNGELDRDLLTMGADPIRYKEIPSLLDGKYVYATGSQEVQSVLHLLFSDQSNLTYIDEALRDRNAAALILNNRVAYDDFHHYQKTGIDHLVSLGVLEATGNRVTFVDIDQLLVLSRIFSTQAASYFHLSAPARTQADQMVRKGWLTRQSSLLTVAEADYFNYFLNRVGFSNGPNLRNRYLHGAQAHTDSDQTHFHTYLVAIRMIAALVIKINDDLCLTEAESPN